MRYKDFKKFGNRNISYIQESIYEWRHILREFINNAKIIFFSFVDQIQLCVSFKIIISNKVVLANNLQIQYNTNTKLFKYFIIM